MKVIYGLLVIAIFFTACKNESENSESSEKKKAEIEKIAAVCISNGVPVRTEPSTESKYLTSLNLGESMLYLGEKIADSTNTKKVYYKVELSDGTIAWARTYGVILEGKPAAIMDETPIYKRPDLVNKTDKTFNPLEFVVITSDKEEWVEVVGAGKKKSGWIKKQALSTETLEVAVSTLAQKSLLDSKGQIEIEKAASFMEELPYKNSILGAYVQYVLDEQAQTIIEDAIGEAIEEAQGNIEPEVIDN